MPNVVKISKRSNRKVGDSEYFKYSVNLSNKIMDDLNWDGDTQVNMKVKDKKLVIEEEEE